MGYLKYVDVNNDGNFDSEDRTYLGAPYPKFTSGPSTISRFNGTRSIQITGQTGNGYSSGQAMNAIKEVVQQNAGTGFTFPSHFTIIGSRMPPS